MKPILILLLLAFAYSIPNPVYVIKDCFEKLYDYKSNENLQWSVDNELLNWKVNEFYAKVDAIDPNLKPKIEECVREVNKKFSRPRKRPSFATKIVG